MARRQSLFRSMGLRVQGDGAVAAAARAGTRRRLDELAATHHNTPEGNMNNKSTAYRDVSRAGNVDGWQRCRCTPRSAASDGSLVGRLTDSDKQAARGRRSHGAQSGNRIHAARSRPTQTATTASRSCRSASTSSKRRTTAPRSASSRTSRFARRGDDGERDSRRDDAGRNPGRSARASSPRST